MTASIGLTHADGPSGSSGSDGSIGLIWAEAAGGVIGNQGVMPWHLPEDLAHFKAVTLGSPVVMGRKTWDSLPERFRPLPGRRNIVVTRQTGWDADGAEVAHSVADALTLAAGTGSELVDSAATAPGSTASTAAAGAFVWVIGGAEIFASVIDDADRLEVTELNTRVDGDTVAPSVGEAWTLVNADPVEGWHTSRTGLEYRFRRYERR